MIESMINKLTASQLAEELAKQVNEKSTPEDKKKKGQFFTSDTIAKFMARLTNLNKSDVNVLDAGAGIGTLTAALVDRIIEENKKITINVDLFENDESIFPYLKQVMDYCQELMHNHGCRFDYRILKKDYILYHTSLFTDDLFTTENEYKKYDIAIGNPPYFKVNKNHEYSRILSEYVHGQPNVYFMFMVIAEKLLKEGGQIIYITPRSYTSGAYFEKFREKFFEKIDADHIHVFDSRKGNFKGEKVLQETIILSGFKRENIIPYIVVSSSSTSDMENDYEQEVFEKPLIFDSTDQINLIRLPINKEQSSILNIFDNWTNNLSMMNMNISTGPVVTFRNKDLIEPYNTNNNFPLFHMRNLRELTVIFNPTIEDGIRKEGIERKLLIPSRKYILLKRFTSKEQKRRVDVAAYDSDKFNFEWIGLENHLNYIYKEDGELSSEELYGILAFLNSNLVDQYFRIVNGNTQVNASDIRPLPFPEYEQIIDLGRKILENSIDYQSVDSYLLNIEKKTRGSLVSNKEGQALDILRQLELPKKQQNQRSALTLLALLNITENDKWESAEKVLLRIVDIMEFMAINYDKHYAPNSREPIRRQTIHQFEQAQLIVRNPDNPNRATNSKNTVYAVTDELLTLIKSYGTMDWKENLDVFKSQFKTLTQKYETRRKLTRVPVKVSPKVTLELSPGEHNELQKAIVEDFASYFAPGSHLLYLGDTENKYLYIDKEKLSKLNFPELHHDKLPDVVLYQEEKNWVFLCEAVTSHGPISDKRKYELEKMLGSCSVGLVFVTAFPNISTFKKYADDIAWETEVWFSDNPKHMMHLNGDRFMGPR